MEWLTRFTECVFSVGHHVSSTYESDRVLFFPPFSPTSPLFFARDAPDAVVWWKYILVWRWTDKSFSTDRLKYKLRFERSSSPIYTGEIILPPSTVHLSLRKGEEDFHTWKIFPCVYYSYYYYSLFRSLLCSQSMNVFLNFLGAFFFFSQQVWHIVL